MADVPDVSVVMSVYNDAERLSDSIGSIIEQEGVDFEFIIVNDGSKDESPQIVDQYAAEDRRIRPLHQENRGLTQALIRGCEEARGELIARQDADDVSLPGRLHKLHDLLRADERIAFASSWAQVYGPKGELLDELRRPQGPEEASDLLMNGRTGPPGHGTVMFRRGAYEQVGGYRPEFYFSQDSDLWLRLGEVGLLAYCPEFLYAFRYDVRSISSSYRTAQRQLGGIVHDCRRDRLEGRDESASLARAAAIRPPFPNLGREDEARGPYFIAGCLRARRDRRAVGYYWTAIGHRPWLLAAWWGLLCSLLFGRNRTHEDPVRKASMSKSVEGADAG